MNFFSAFSETIGKEAAASGNSSGNTSDKNSSDNASQNITSDDMKAYVDAKFEALKSDLVSEMQNFNKKVETPKETDKLQEDNNNSQKEGGNNNASSSDLSNSQHDSQ